MARQGVRVRAGNVIQGAIMEDVQVPVLVILIWAVVGGIIGWLASQIMTEGGYGVLVDILIGVVAGVLGAIILPRLPYIGVLVRLSGGDLSQLVNAAIGAVVGTFVGRTVKRYL
jgi:uncharacterized membrane protein YeaQ/YmgE (transglycosylase-associated protein family)